MNSFFMASFLRNQIKWFLLLISLMNKYKALVMKKRALMEQINKINMDNRPYKKLFGEKNSELSEKKVIFYNKLSEIEK